MRRSCAGTSPAAPYTPSRQSAGMGSPVGAAHIDEPSRLHEERASVFCTPSFNTPHSQGERRVFSAFHPPGLDASPLHDGRDIMGLNLGGVVAANGSPSSRPASTQRTNESSGRDHKPSWLLQVHPDPDAVPEDNNAAIMGDTAAAPEASEAPGEAPAEAPAEETVDHAVGAGTENISATPATPASESKPTRSPVVSRKKIQEANKFYQNKKLLTPRSIARRMKADAAARGDIAARRAADGRVREAKSQVAQRRREDMQRHMAATKIQGWERVRRAIRKAAEMRLFAWAVLVVQKDIRRCIQRARTRAAAKAAAEKAARAEAERRAEEAARKLAQKIAAKEEEERLAAEREAEERSAPGAARRRAHEAGNKEKEARTLKQKKSREQAAQAAKAAAEMARREAEREEREVELKMEELRRMKETEAARQQSQKQEALQIAAAAQAAAREEAFAVVRNFADGMQELAMAGVEQRDSIRTAGGIPPLVAMLGGGTLQQSETAAATALTWLSSGSEANRVAIRHAGGIPPLIALAASCIKTGSMKYVPAMTNLSSGSIPENQDAIREAGGIPLLVGLLTGGPDSKITCDAADALRHLTYGNQGNCNAIREANGIMWLVALLGAGPDSGSATDAIATLCQISEENPANQDAIREAGGIRPIIALLAGGVDSEALKWAARSLVHLSRDNATNRSLICEQQGTIARLVALLAAGAESEAANLSADVLRCLMLGHDDRVAVTVLATMKRQGIGLGQNSTFSLADAFPGLLEGLTAVVSSRLSAAVKGGRDRAQIQMALNDAIALELPEEQLDAARARLDSIAAARAEAIAARRLRKKGEKDSKAEAEAKAAAAAKAAATSAGTKSTQQDNAEARAAAAASGAQVTGAQAVLLEAQARLREIEAAAALARRQRREAVLARRLPGAKRLNTLARKVSSKAAEENPLDTLHREDQDDQMDDPDLDLRMQLGELDAQPAY